MRSIPDHLVGNCTHEVREAVFVSSVRLGCDRDCAGGLSYLFANDFGLRVGQLDEERVRLQG
jgi:hypothetical protein